MSFVKFDEILSLFVNCGQMGSEGVADVAIVVLYLIASFNLFSSACLIVIIISQESGSRKSRYRLMIAMIAMWQVTLVREYMNRA